MTKRFIFTLAILFSAFAVFSETELKTGTEMLVTENLRLRNKEGTAGTVKVSLLADSRVKIIELGKNDKIDGISSRWVKVETLEGAKNIQNENLPLGVTGYCFAGYLKEAEPVHKANYNGSNGEVLKNSETKTETTTIRKLVLNQIVIGDLISGYSRNVYAKADEKSEMLYTLQDNDKIDISELWEITRKKDNFETVWLKINVNSKNGFILYGKSSITNYKAQYIHDSSSDPFYNDVWEVLGTIQTKKQKFTARKLQQWVSVFVQADFIEMHALPDNDSEVTGKIPSSYKNGNDQINIETEAITEETFTYISRYNGNELTEHWLRTTWNGKTGWLDGRLLSVERGGPKYQTPENEIEFDLGWYDK